MPLLCLYGDCVDVGYTGPACQHAQCSMPKSSYSSWCIIAVCHLSCDMQIDDLNLLIFDKCHGAIKRDPSNCIMQEFYHDSKNKVCAVESLDETKFTVSTVSAAFTETILCLGYLCGGSLGWAGESANGIASKLLQVYSFSILGCCLRRLPL